MVRQCLRVGKKLSPIYVGKLPQYADMRTAQHLPSNLLKWPLGFHSSISHFGQHNHEKGPCPRGEALLSPPSSKNSLRSPDWYGLNELKQSVPYIDPHLLEGKQNDRHDIIDVKTAPITYYNLSTVSLLSVTMRNNQYEMKDSISNKGKKNKRFNRILPQTLVKKEKDSIHIKHR